MILRCFFFSVSRPYKQNLKNCHSRMTFKCRPKYILPPYDLVHLLDIFMELGIRHFCLYVLYLTSGDSDTIASNGQYYTRRSIRSPCKVAFNSNYYTVNQLFTSVQHLLLLIIGLHVSTDHSVIFRSLICCKFQRAVHTCATY